MKGSSRIILDDLIRRRKDAGISQTRMSQLVGKERSWVANLENRQHEPNIRTLEWYAEALGLQLQFRFVPIVKDEV